MSKKLGQLESLVHENPGFAADVAVAELVRRTATMLKSMRERAGLNQAQLGEKIGRSQGRISQIESGLMDHAPNLETIALYANACAESVTFQASGEGTSEHVEVDEIFVDLFAGDTVYGYAATPFELVAKRPALRAAILKLTGITQVEGSANRFRLSDPLSADVMDVLGLTKR